MLRGKGIDPDELRLKDAIVSTHRVCGARLLALAYHFHVWIGALEEVAIGEG